MTNFIPGKEIATFKSTKDRNIQIRYPKWEDVNSLLGFINKVSKEDTFITFSGEQLSLSDESKFLAGKFVEMELKNAVFIVCEYDGQIIGTTEVTRNKEELKRGEHIGILGITIDQDFRGEGIGSFLLETAVEQAKMHIDGLMKIILNVYSINEIAMSMYEKAGFKNVGTISKSIKYKQNYIDKHIMELPV